MKTRHFVARLTLVAVLSFLVTSFAMAETSEGVTFTVTATTDVVDNLPGDGVCETAPGNGMCTLRAAIMEANALVGADTILLPEATYDLTIAGANEDESATGDLDITETLTILGPDPAFATISAGGLGDRVLQIHDSDALVFVSWVVISHGSVDEYSDGAGVWNKSVLTMQHVEIRNNTAGIGGGGIDNQGVLELAHAVLQSNDAGQGAGLFNEPFAEASLVDVELRYNNATSWGGGIENFGTLSVQDSDFDNNDGGSVGGAVYLYSGSAQIINSTFQANDASDGGGIFVDSDADLTLIGSDVFTNTAETDGGGIYNLGGLVIQDGTIHENTATQSGGGIYNEGDLTIADSDLYENNASFGGGIFNLGVLTIENSELTRNIVSLAGGGLYNNAGTITLENTGFVENSSAGVGGGIVNLEGSIQGHDLWFDLNSAGDRAGAIQNITGGQVELRRATFSNNQAVNNSGAIENYSEGYFTLIESTIIGNTSSAYGGGITNGASFELIRVTITGNQADNGGGITNSNATLMNIENSTISGNEAELNGGGFYNAGTLYTWHSTITGNVASADLISPSGSGGGVFNMDGADFYFSDTILFGNHRRSVIMTDNDCYGTLTTMDYNLVGTLEDCTLEGSQGHDLIGADPLLGTLADNGGSTWTRALQAGSPAIDAANPAGCFGILDVLLTTDQRGHPLPWDGDADGTARCDIGAYEAPLTLVYLPMTRK